MTAPDIFTPARKLSLALHQRGIERTRDDLIRYAQDTFRRQALVQDPQNLRDFLLLSATPPGLEKTIVELTKYETKETL